jgi:hypothetical protein
MALNIKKAKKQELQMPEGASLETAVGMVNIMNKDGSVEESSENILMVQGPGPFANVGVRAKTTINLGNYENIQIEVSLHVPSATHPEKILDAFKYCSAWIDLRMQELCDKYTPPKQG